MFTFSSTVLASNCNVFIDGSSETFTPRTESENDREIKFFITKETLEKVRHYSLSQKLFI